MESAYFTPDIEDFYVGYEFQCKVYGEEDEWVNCIYSRPTDEVFCKDSDDNIWTNDSLRVPYLTKEQIEAEGWKEFITEYRGDIKLENMNYVFFNEKSNYMLGWFFNRNQIGLLVADPSKALDINGNIINYNDTPRYTGECKDINTFRKICKLLRI